MFFKGFNWKCQLAVLLVVVMFSMSPLLAAQKPNVIVIFTDDQGSVDMNIYGSTDLVTPNMDQLARDGIRFTQFYATGPVCVPSRVGLMTGRMPHNGGLYGSVPLGSQVFISQEMKKAGYTTAHIGKWHLAHGKNAFPNDKGFDYSFGHIQGCIDNYSHFFYWNGPNRHDLWRNGKEVFHDGEFFPDLMVKEASEFMKKNKDKPFFMYYAMNSPHYPYQGTDKWMEHYSDLEYPRNLYAAFISTMDERIGQLLEKLDDLGLRENTIVIFQSDQGHSTEERAHGGGGNSGPYRGSKFTMYEGGLCVPAIISWPGHLPKNQVRTQMATGSDWYPTILELCKLPVAKHRIDGKSLLPILTDAEAPSAHESFYWRQNKTWAVRQGKWKLIISDKKTELYDIPNDIGEAKNLATEHPAIVTELKNVGKEYRERAVLYK
jgi:arylsulfatase A